MGILNLDDNIDAAFDDVEVGKGRLSDGEYDGVVKAVNIQPGRKPWVDQQLSVTLEAQKGGVAFADIELAPLTDREGNLSKGKLKFLKWQLESLGYQGKLSELEYNLEGLFGAGVKFKVETTIQDKVNPNTGKNYTNTDVVLVENIHPGIGGVATMQTVPSAAVAY